MKIKYVVTAKKWSDEIRNVIDYTAGEFYDIVCATMFIRAYEAHFCTKCELKQYYI